MLSESDADSYARFRVEIVLRNEEPLIPVSVGYELVVLDARVSICVCRPGPCMGFRRGG